jgi:DNA polymerase epsilon subunit 1
VPDLLTVRKVLMPIAEKNKKNLTAMDTYAEVSRFAMFTYAMFRNAY